MNLKILRSRSLGHLKDKLETDFNRYTNLEDPIITENDLIESNIEVNDPPLLKLGGSSHDAENAKLIHGWLHQLTPIEASDERIWAYLCIAEFREYAVDRWKSSNARTVKSHFFYSGNGLRTAVLNSISRLWWASYLTCKPSSAHPYRLTELFLSNQDIHTAFSQRSIGLCRPLLNASLEYLSEIRDKTSNFSEFTQAFAVEIRIRSGVLVIDSLTTASIKTLVEECGEAVSDKLDS